MSLLKVFRVGLVASLRQTIGLCPEGNSPQLMKGKKKWYGTKDKDGCWSKKDALSTRSIVERVYCRLVSMPFEVGKTRVDRSFDFCSLPLWRLV